MTRWTLASRRRVSAEALRRHADDAAVAARFGELVEAARQAEEAVRNAERRGAADAERYRLARDLDAALTAAMRAAYAAERAAIGPRGYEDRIYRRKAKAKPEIKALTAEAERLLTLRENYRVNGLPPAPPRPLGSSTSVTSPAA